VARGRQTLEGFGGALESSIAVAEAGPRRTVAGGESSSPRSGRRSTGGQLAKGRGAEHDGCPMPLTPKEFIAELDAQNRAALQRIATMNATPPGSMREVPPPSEALSVARLLKLALKNEMEATECSAAWISSTEEMDAKLAFARQVGDEAKHYRLIQKRLIDMGVDVAAFNPFAQGRSSLASYLLELRGTVARVAAGPFTREALALVRNDEFIHYCEQSGDATSAALYQDVIQKDEEYHHELGRTLLLRLATTDEAQAAARASSRRVLELAEEIQEVARMKAGIAHAPGC
jgi:1,2-phenylacetyl-CoA epoxidase catalytic subunit